VLKPILSDIDEQKLTFKDHKCRREQEFIFIPQLRPEVSIQKVQVSSVPKTFDILTLIRDACNTHFHTRVHIFYIQDVRRAHKLAHIFTPIANITA
jgi:hypothetical protein